MREVLEAIAQTLRNLGVEATSDYDSVTCNGCCFYARGHRRGFHFCGRFYKTGNVKQAVLDLLLEMAVRIRQRDEYRIHLANVEAARALTAKLDGAMTVSYDRRLGFVLTFTSSDLAMLSGVAAKLAAELNAEWTATWAALQTQKSDIPVRFTAEGGFSLN